MEACKKCVPKRNFLTIDNSDNTRWDILWQLRMRISGFREQKQLRRVTFGSLDWRAAMCVRVIDAVDFFHGFFLSQQQTQTLASQHILIDSLPRAINTTIYSR